MLFTGTVFIFNANLAGLWWIFFGGGALISCFETLGILWKVLPRMPPLHRENAYGPPCSSLQPWLRLQILNRCLQVDTTSCIEHSGLTILVILHLNYVGKTRLSMWRVVMKISCHLTLWGINFSKIWKWAWKNHRHVLTIWIFVIKFGDNTVST